MGAGAGARVPPDWEGTPILSRNFADIRGPTKMTTA